MYHNLISSSIIIYDYLIKIVGWRGPKIVRRISIHFSTYNITTTAVLLLITTNKRSSDLRQTVGYFTNLTLFNNISFRV